MISKLLNYHRKIPPIVIRIALAESIQMIAFSFIFMVFMLMVIHLLIAGELGICYWSAERGWVWN